MRLENSCFGTYQVLITKLKSYFDLSLSEAAKSLLVDAILLEAIEGFQSLKIWKEASLETDRLTGTVDYLIAPQGKVSTEAGIFQPNALTPGPSPRGRTA